MKSMTAFARKEMRQKQSYLCWEIRSVNNRYLDVSFRLPDIFRELELSLRECASKYLTRGKIDCSLRYQSGVESQVNIAVNDALLSQLLDVSGKIYKKFPQDHTVVGLIDLLRFPGVMSMQEEASSDIQSVAKELFEKTVAALGQSRMQEGKRLKRFLEQRLRKIEMGVKKIRVLMPRVVKDQRERLLSRCQELKLTLDPNRLEQEVAMLAQRLDIYEELDRLHSHVEEVNRAMNTEDNCGRRLDFLMQELNREANTIASKSVNKTVTHQAVELKVLIEQMREQIQNIE